MVWLGAIEGGGTKFLCARAETPDAPLEVTRIATRDPETTLREVLAYFRANPVETLGVACFGPLELRRDGPTPYGSLLETPKPGWSGFPLVSRLADALRVPVVVDTDVNAAALAEAARAAGRDPLVYFTVGTGIGAGVIVGGRPLHGLLHPELGHLLMPEIRDTAGTLDVFPGVCPFHNRCLEGLASGGAIRARTGLAAEVLPGGHPALLLSAQYVAHGLAAAVLALSPQRIVVGGGLAGAPGYLATVRATLTRVLGGYIQRSELAAEIGSYVVAPAWGPEPGLRGALLLAARVAEGA